MTDLDIVQLNTLKEGQCNELCSSGKCKADCCGCVCFPEGHFKILKKFIPEGKTYQLVKYKENGIPHIKPVTLDGKCVFLTKSYSCVIYGSHLRPSLCKNFGSDPSIPILACSHINEDVKEEIREFQIQYLKYMSSKGNTAAGKMAEWFEKAEAEGKLIGEASSIE